MKDKKTDWKSLALTIGSLVLTIGAGIVGNIRSDKMMKDEIDQAVNDALETRGSEES